MIIGIGTDIIETSRIQSAIEKYGKRFLNKLFTETEQEYSEQFNDTKFVHYAARFAAKEAFSKAIGTGITQGFKFRDVGVENLKSGQPIIVLDGEMKEKYGHLKVHITLSHSDNYSVAYVILEDQ